MNAGKVALGVLAGVAIGSVLGMLIAPHKGSETRRKLVKKGNDFAGNTENQMNGLVDKMAKKFQPMNSK
jgi:gas vesicle protein